MLNIKTAIRSFRSQPIIPTLNLFGLSLGIACFLTISLYIYQETTYETEFSDYDRIYRVEEKFMSMGELAWSSSNLAHKLPELPVVEQHTRVNAPGEMQFSLNDQIFKVENVLLADNHFFQIFDYPFIAGNSAEALSGPGKIVLSEKIAQRLFGRSDVVGEKIEMEEDLFMVSGVVRMNDLKSHLDFDAVAYQKVPSYVPQRWLGIGGYSYVKVIPSASKNQLQGQLNEMTERDVFSFLYRDGLKSDAPMIYEEWTSAPNSVTFSAKLIREIYTNSNLQFELGANGDRQTRMTLSIIGIFVLVIALINFMNLSTSSASTRAKEVGVKKVLGAGKNRLIRQFLVQSVVFTLLAAVIGSGFSELFTRLINLKLGEVIGISLLDRPELILGLIALMLLLGVLAGAYPAFYLSSVKSIPLLKGKTVSQFLNVRSALIFRNSLVVFQFIISSALIAASIIVLQQMSYLQTLDLGYDKEQVIVISNAYELGDKQTAFRNDLMTLPAIAGVSATKRVPSDGSNSTLATVVDSDTPIQFGQFYADEHLAEVLGLELIEGEFFDAADRGNDSLVIINESAAQTIGLEDPIGKTFGANFKIKGIVKDFKFADVRAPIGPAVLFVSDDSHARTVLRINTGDFQIAEINELWKEYSEIPMEAQFLNDQYEKLLEKEKQATDAVLVFTILAILIAVLGLFGLATFSAEQRKHEFGIRRVLGASFQQIIGLFGLHFIKLIAIAFLISVPIAFYGLNEWLNGFADRIDISTAVFLLTGLLVILIAGLILLTQGIRASTVNPIQTLRDE